MWGTGIRNRDVSQHLACPAVSKLSKRHHYIGVSHQERFADANGFLHAYDKTRPDKGVDGRQPKNLFVEGHRYSAIRPDGSRDSALEDRLAVLEGRADPIMERIAAAARRNQTPRLTAVEFDIWVRYFVIQWKRVPDLHLEVTTDADAAADVRRLIGELREIFPHRGAELDAMETPDEIRRTVQNARVNSLEHMSAEVEQAMRARGLGIVRCPPGKRFVLASRPVAKFSLPGQGNLLNPEVEMWLPIAEDVAAGIGAGPGSERIFRATTDQVRHINLTLLKQSTIIASASPTLIRSLIRDR